MNKILTILLSLLFISNIFAFDKATKPVYYNPDIGLVVATNTPLGFVTSSIPYNAYPPQLTTNIGSAGSGYYIMSNGVWTSFTLPIIPTIDNSKYENWIFDPNRTSNSIMWICPQDVTFTCVWAYGQAMAGTTTVDFVTKNTNSLVNQILATNGTLIYTTNSYKLYSWTNAVITSGQELGLSIRSYSPSSSNDHVGLKHVP